MLAKKVFQNKRPVAIWYNLGSRESKKFYIIYEMAVFVLNKSLRYVMQLLLNGLICYKLGYTGVYVPPLLYCLSVQLKSNVRAEKHFFLFN